MAEVVGQNAGTMQTIRSLIGIKSKTPEESRRLVEAVTTLYREYAKDYRTEFERIDDNEKVYNGDHWSGMDFKEDSVATLPEPSTPIITSTVENIKADMSDDFPTVVVSADFEEPSDLLAAKVITRVMEDEDDVCGWEDSYDKLCHDTICDGWGVIESGYDFFMNNGFGGSYKRYVVNKNFMCDPQCPDLQNGRACFKMERYPKDWFLQRYPEQAALMSEDTSLVSNTHDVYSATTAPSTDDYYRLIECWIKVYDPKRKAYKVHFVWIAGGQLLEDSAIDKPEGYYGHGAYPFDICTLFPQKGSALGIGIVDHFKKANRLADRLDQIVLVNAFRASKLKKYVMEGAVANISDVANYEKEVVVVNIPPDQAIKWEETKALPAFIFSYIQSIREMIKQESGANDQSRGQTGGGVTAGTAIAALQDMSLKRSRKEARGIAYAARQASIKQVSCLREFDIVPRKIAVSVMGKRKVVDFDKSYFEKTFGEGKMPIEHFISLKTARQTRYSIMEHNEIWLKMMAQLGDKVDPVVMLEGLIMPEKEELLENIRRAQEGGMLQLQTQLGQAMQMIEQLTAQVDSQREALAQSTAALKANAAAQQVKGGAQGQQQRPTPAQQMPMTTR